MKPLHWTLAALCALCLDRPSLAQEFEAPPRRAAEVAIEDRALRDALQAIFLAAEGESIAWERFVHAPLLVERSLGWMSEAARTKVREHLAGNFALVHQRSRPMNEAFGDFYLVSPRFVSVDVQSDRAQVGVIEPNSGLPWMFWMGKDAAGDWKWVDVEDVSTGWMLSAAAAAGLLQRVRSDGMAAEAEAMGDLERCLRAPMLLGMEAGRVALSRLQSSSAHQIRWLADAKAAIAAEDGDLETLGTLVAGPRPLPQGVLARARDLGYWDGVEADLRAHLQRVSFDVSVIRELAQFLEQKGDPEGAGALWEQAADLLPMDGGLLVSLLDSLPEERVGEVPRRLAAVSEPAWVLDGIVSRLLARGHREEAKACLDLVARIDPEDHNVAYYNARMLADQGRFPQAAALLVQAFHRAEVWGELEIFHGFFVELMDGAGKAAEGYRIADRSEAALERALALLSGRLDWRAVVDLCQEHRSSMGEPFGGLDMWQARGEMALGNHNRAAELALVALQQATSDEDWEAAIALRLDALWAMGGWSVAYRELGEPPLAFWRVANRLSNLREGRALAELIQVHREGGADPVASRLAYWECEVIYLTGTPAEAAAALEQRREEIVDPSFPALLYRYEDRLVRSLVRSKALDRALEVALAIDGRDDDAFYTTLVRAARGEREAARAALVRALAQGVRPEILLRDPDLGPLLEGSDYADLLPPVDPEGPENP